MEPKPYANEVFRSALKLLYGTGAAQAITLLSVPLLTRLFSTEAFGVLGLFMAGSSLAGALATGRYESAIPLPREEPEAWALFRLALGASGALCAFALLAALPLNGMNGLGGWWPVLPLGVWIMAAINTSESWLNRQGEFGQVSRSRFAGALVMVTIQLAFGQFVVGGSLVPGYLLGFGLTALWNLVHCWRRRPQGAFAIREAAQSYRRFPQYLLLAQVSNSASNHLPTFVMGNFFGLGVAGLYTVASRALSVVDLLATAITQAFYPHTARAYSLGVDCRPILLTTVLRLLVAAGVIFPMLAWVAPSALAWALGEPWREAGGMIRLLVPLYFARFVLSPSGHLQLIAGRQGLFLFRQLLQLGLVALALGVGVWAQSYASCLLLYGFTFALGYLLDGYLALEIVRTRPLSAEPAAAKGL